MFERFTRDARAVVVAACEESERSGDGHVGAEHLLIGAARAGAAGFALADLGMTPEVLRAAIGPRDADALATLGIDLEEVRRRVEDSFGAGALDPTPNPRRRRPFTAEAKRILEQSLHEARAARARRIESAHVVLALATVGGARVDALLRQCDVTRGELRAAVERAGVGPTAGL